MAEVGAKRNESNAVPGSLRMLGLVVAALASLALLARTLFSVGGDGPWPWYVALFTVYLGIYVAVVLRPPSRLWRLHLLLAADCVLVLMMVTMNTEQDWLTSLFIPLALPVALWFSGRTVWWWVAGLAALTVGSLAWHMGPLRSLSLTMVTMAAELLFAALVVAVREIESARRQSQAMLQELQATHRRLQAYAAQAGELAALDQRDRVARDLNDSVAETVSGILADARAARAALTSGAGPAAGTRDEAAQRLVALQAQTQEALAQMRRLIAELRPKADQASAAEPTTT